MTFDIVGIPYKICRASLSLVTISIAMLILRK